MANNPRDFPKKESPLIRWYQSHIPGSTFLPSGVVRLTEQDDNEEKATEDQFNELHSLVTKEFLAQVSRAKLLLKI